MYQRMNGNAFTQIIKQMKERLAEHAPEHSWFPFGLELSVVLCLLPQHEARLEQSEESAD